MCYESSKLFLSRVSKQPHRLSDDFPSSGITLLNVASLANFIFEVFISNQVIPEKQKIDKIAST